MGITVLPHTNVPPAQTWNYLRINELALEVDAPRSAGDVFARLPRLFDGIETGTGTDVTSWIEGVAGDAIYVEVGANEERETPVLVTASSGEHRDVGVLVREGATARIVVVAADGDDAASATLLRVIAERNARVSITEIVATTHPRTHIGSIGITASDNATVDVRQYALGEGTIALGMTTELAGSSARLTHAMRYLVRGCATLDVNHVVRMRGRTTRADVASGGVLGEGATKTMRETIDLAHGAKGAVGSESETVLVTGETVTNKTLPTILCDEEDVAGNHGASIGSVSAEQRAYLADRGINEADVESLFVRALFDDALIHAGSPEAGTAVLARAATVLGPDVATDIAEVLGLGSESEV